MQTHEHIDNIIFDLGNVLIPLRLDSINEIFGNLTKDSITPEQLGINARDTFHAYETGKISTHQFLTNLKEYFKQGVSNSEIEMAWNMILGDFPVAHVEMLKKLAPGYRLFVLSNTNELHAEKFETEVPGVTHINDLFEKLHYSHIEGLRKPQMELYERVLKQNNLNPSETLFADDLPENLEPAEKLGIRTLHVTPGLDLPEWFRRQM